MIRKLFTSKKKKLLEEKQELELEVDAARIMLKMQEEKIEADSRVDREQKDRELALREEELEVERRKIAAQNRAIEYLQTENIKTVQQVEYVAPELPRGVVPDGKTAAIAMDSCADMYGYAGAGTASFYPAFLGYPTLANMSQSSDYRSVPETTATEMTREWGLFKSVDADGIDENLTDVEREKALDQAKAEKAIRQDKIVKLHDEFKRLNIRGLIQKAIEVEMTFGRSQIFIDLGEKEDSSLALPFIATERGVSKGQLKGFSVIEPMWSTPSVYNADDPTRQDFYVPERWYVLARDVHQSRLITIVMRPVSDVLKPAYNFGGISMLQLMQPYVQRYQRTADSISQLVHAFSLTMLATDMSGILAGEADTNPMLRMKLFNQYRDNTGIMLTDKADEEISQINTPLTGLPDLLRQSQEQMAAPSHTPLVKLLGITPSGLNANSDGEIRVYYDYIMAQNEAHIRPVIEKISDIVQLSLFGEIDPAIQWFFNPLQQMDAKELADIQKVKADTSQVLIDSGVVSQQEAREVLATDEDSQYTNIAVEDVPVSNDDYEGF